MKMQAYKFRGKTGVKIRQATYSYPMTIHEKKYYNFIELLLVGF